MSSNGTGTGFGIRSEGQLILVANQLHQQATLDADGLLLRTVAPLGYGPGSGGTATQPTSKSTAITLHKPSGRITMHPESLAAGASVVFVMSNSCARSGDVVVVNPVWNWAEYSVSCVAVTDGWVTFRVTNITSVALSAALVISFDLFRGALA